MVSRREIETLRAKYPDLAWWARDGAPDQATDSPPEAGTEPRRER